MTSDAPGPGTPGSDRPEDPEATAAGQWPPELVPPTAPDPEPPGAPAAPSGPTSGTWGTTPSSGTWGAAPQAPAPQTPPVPQTPTGGGWGEPVPPAAPTQPVDTSWGAPPVPPPAGQPGQWGAPPVPPPGGQPGQWGAPPPGAGGWAPGSGVPGGWAPAPPTSNSNGCLKACLIVGGIIVVLGIIGVVLLGVFADRLVQDMGFNPDGTVDECSVIASSDVQAILGPDFQAVPLGGLVDGTVGLVLDKRVLPEAPDCWLFSDSGSSFTGRIAQQDGNAAATFAAARAEAQAGGYDAGDASAGDEAFCTGMSEVGSFGILVRRGDSLAYVALLDAEAMQEQQFEVGEDGVFASPQTCDLAGQLAEAALR